MSGQSTGGSTDPTTPGHVPPDRQLEFMEHLLDEHVIVADDVIEIATDTFALHGSLAVDGEMILAEYRSEVEARAALTELSAFARDLDQP